MKLLQQVLAVVSVMAGNVWRLAGVGRNSFPPEKWQDTVPQGLMITYLFF